MLCWKPQWARKWVAYQHPSLRPAVVSLLRLTKVYVRIDLMTFIRCRSFYCQASGRDFWVSQYEAEPVPLSSRYEVLKRAGKRCELCGVAEGDENYQERLPLHVDHITPRSKGESNDLDNLQALCRACNLGRGNRDDTDFR